MIHNLVCVADQGGRAPWLSDETFKFLIVHISSIPFSPSYFRQLSRIMFDGPRSKGFGFVTFEKEDDAKRALEELQGTEFDGRHLRFEKAAPRKERPPRSEEDGAEYRPRRGRGGRRLYNRRPRPTGPPSTTTLYIGNLPFNATDEDLMNVFEGFKVVSAKVIVYSKTKTSKGFGYVELANEEEQKRAMEELAGAEVDGRSLRIRAAISREHTAEGEAEEEETSNA